LITRRTEVIEILLKIIRLKDVFNDRNLEIKPETATWIEQQISAIEKLF